MSSNDSSLSTEERLLVEAWRRNDLAMLLALCQVTAARLQGSRPLGLPEATISTGPEENLDALVGGPTRPAPLSDVEGAVSQDELEAMLAAADLEADDGEPVGGGVIAVGTYRIDVGPDADEGVVRGSTGEEIGIRKTDDAGGTTMTQEDLDKLLGF